MPNVGKSTLFNAITHAGAQAANFPFCTIEPNVGVVAVPDERLSKLAALYNSKKVTPATIEFVDIAGLVKGASKGEGLGNKFLSHIREVDAIVHVVRCFEDENVTHVENSVDPVRDIGIINLELILADMETVQKRYDKAYGMIKSGDKKYKVESDLLKRILDRLESETPVRGMELTEDEQKYVNDLFLLTTKPVIYAANVSEADMGKDGEDIPLAKEVIDYAKKTGSETLVICARTEEEISELPPDEALEIADEFCITPFGSAVGNDERSARKAFHRSGGDPRSHGYPAHCVNADGYPAHGDDSQSDGPESKNTRGNRASGNSSRRQSA